MWISPLSNVRQPKFFALRLSWFNFMKYCIYIVTTNKNCQELKYMYSERIMDRLTAKCLVLETKGPSQRRRYLNALSTIKKETSAISKEVA